MLLFACKELSDDSQRNGGTAKSDSIMGVPVGACAVN